MGEIVWIRSAGTGHRTAARAPSCGLAALPQWKHSGKRGHANGTGTMQVEALRIQDVKLLTPKIFRDERGFFSETYNRQVLAAAGIDRTFVQDNQSLSRSKGVLRGLHFQIVPHPQGKLVRVTRGAIFDVAVDIRRGSPSFGQHVSTTLSAENWSQLWIPEGFAHGFCTLEPDTEVIYKVTDFYAPECDRGLAWDDPDLGIAWPLSETQALLSDKDRSHPRLRDLPTHFVTAT